MNKEESPLFTAKQGQYLAFIYYYTKVNGIAPAESDLSATLEPHLQVFIQ